LLGGSDYTIYWAKKVLALERATSSLSILNPTLFALYPNFITDIHEAFMNTYKSIYSPTHKPISSFSQLLCEN
jgi:hypothetical protein